MLPLALGHIDWNDSTAAAILYTAAVLYPTSVSRSSSVPAFLPNLVRKITALESIQADGAQVLVATAAADVKTEFLSRLESRTEELIEETGPDDPAQAHLRAYLATVRGAR